MVLFGVLLWLCILARHINALLAGLLPLTFLRAQRISFDRDSDSLDHNHFAAGIDYGGGRRSRKRPLLSLSVLVHHARKRVAKDVVLRRSNVPYHSVVGFAFLGRLKFLARVTRSRTKSVTRRSDEKYNLRRR